MAEIIPLTRTPKDRIESALRVLAVAQAEQKRALNEFRESLYLLRDRTARLQDGVHGWHRALGDAQAGATLANQAARRLEATTARL
jgi:hypothetical protein